MLALALGVGIVFIAAVLIATGVIDLSRFTRQAPSTAGLVAVPTLGRPIPAYARVTRDFVWDPNRNSLAVLYLPPKTVSKEMILSVSEIVGRVMAHDKAPGYVFTEDDFLPKGTREGLTAGIPAGKRAFRVSEDQVDGLFGLRTGDRFDLVATLPIDSGRGGTGMAVGGVFGGDLALQSRLSNWEKQATVRVMAQSGVIVMPLGARQVSTVQNSLTDGSRLRTRTVQEAVIAIGPEEVTRLTEAIAVQARVSIIPRSGRPDDPEQSVTPDLEPVSPFAAGSDEPSGGFARVETIMGGTHAMAAVPRR
jgi:Flp pilus assembly protein CpaB